MKNVQFFIRICPRIQAIASKSALIQTKNNVRIDNTHQWDILYIQRMRTTENTPITVVRYCVAQKYIHNFESLPVYRYNARKRSNAKNALLSIYVFHINST